MHGVNVRLHVRLMRHRPVSSAFCQSIPRRKAGIVAVAGGTAGLPPIIERVDSHLTQHAILVGAGPGLGAALARRFAREGFRFTLVARKADKLAALIAKLRAQSIDVRPQIADVADFEGLKAAMTQAQGEAGPATLMIFNPAVLSVWEGIDSYDAEGMIRDHRVNVAALVPAVQAVLPAMRAAGGGSILVTSADPTNYLGPIISPLRLGKAALNQLVDILHEELTPENIHVTAMKILGPIRPNDYFDPDRVAECYAQCWAKPAAMRRPLEELTIRAVELANGEGVVLPSRPGAT